MTTATAQPRIKPGVPTGGQWSATPRDTASGALQPGDETTLVYPEQPDAMRERYDTVEAKLEAVRGELTAAVAALDDDDNWLNYLALAAKFHRYSFSNQMLIYLQTGGRATQVAGFRAWKEKFGRSVRAGAKGIVILAPKVARTDQTDADGKPVLGADGKPVKRSRVVGFTTATVFDVTQTEGPPLPTIERELDEEPPEGFVDDLTAAAEAEGWKVEFRELESMTRGGPQGWSDPATKTIVVDATLTSGSAAATLAHEVGHVYAGHCAPEHAASYAAGTQGCRGQFETEAESIAYVLTRANGMSMDGAKLSAQYVSGWSRKDPSLIHSTGETVAKTSKRILEAVSFRNLSDD